MKEKSENNTKGNTMLFWFKLIFGFNFQKPFQHVPAFGYLIIVKLYAQKNIFWRFSVLQIFFNIHPCLEKEKKIGTSRFHVFC